MWWWEGRKIYDSASLFSDTGTPRFFCLPEFSLFCLFFFVFGTIFFLISQIFWWFLSKLRRRSRWVNVPSSSDISGSSTSAPFPLASTASSSSMTTNPGGESNGSSEKLTISREEIVKGVVIKGIVCTPKTKQKNKSSSKTSLNPFEKRVAPAPPPPSDSVSASVSKNKTKKRGFSKKWRRHQLTSDHLMSVFVPSIRINCCWPSHHVQSCLGLDKDELRFYLSFK